MKRIKKFVAVMLTVIMLSALSLPVMSFAAEEATTAQNDHTSFEEFWAQMTDEDGNVDWTKLPKVLFKAFVAIRMFEVVISFFRSLFGINTDTGADVETTTAIPELPTLAG